MCGDVLPVAVRYLLDIVQILWSMTFARIVERRTVSRMVQIDMDMPTRCFDCMIEQADDYTMSYECPLVYKGYTGKIRMTGRLAECPLRDVQARKTAEWVYGEKDGTDGWYCSKCGFHIPWYYDYYGLKNINFIRDFHTCPHCDAKMTKYTGMKGE